MLNQEQQIFEQIKKAGNILITFNKIWTGDGLASALAFYLFLKKLDKNVTIAADKFDGGEIFKFLPAYDKINHSLTNVRKFIISLDTANAKVEKIKYKSEDNRLNFIISTKDGFFTHDDIKSYPGDFKYDLIIALDTPDLESLGSVYESDTEFFYNVPIINIDHHSENESFGQINNVELTSTSTAEIVFDLLSNYSRDLLDEDIATCLLAGMISKTRSFKTQNITPQTLSVSAQLISMGARREEIINALYRSRSLALLKLWGRVLARLNSSPDSLLVWSILSKDDFIKTGASEEDLSEVIEELIVNIPSAKIILIIYEIPEVIQDTVNKNITKALIYTLKNINAMDLVKEWQPQGTKNMAKITIPASLQEAENLIGNALKDGLNRIQI